MTKKQNPLALVCLMAAFKQSPSQPFTVLRHASEDAKGRAAAALAMGDVDGLDVAIGDFKAAEEAREVLTTLGGPEALAQARAAIEKAAAKVEKTGKKKPSSSKKGQAAKKS